jgi:DNA-binding beta-propeller fold protein YncE
VQSSSCTPSATYIPSVTVLKTRRVSCVCRAPACLSASSRGVLVCDGNNKRLRLIPMDTTTGQPSMSQTIFAGSGSIAGVAESADGEIFVADLRAQQVQRIAKGKATVIAGHPVSQGLPTMDGRASEATFKVPAGIAVDQSMNIYVADAGDHKVRRISRRTNSVATFAGRCALA